MAIDLAFSIASGSAVAQKDAVHILATGLDSTLTYYIQFEQANQDDLRSVVFGPNHDGEFQWDGLIFPATGTWAGHVYNAATDADLDTENYVVV